MTAGENIAEEHLEQEMVVAGVNHRVAPVQVRERLAIPRAQAGAVAGALREQYGLRSAVVLSTCNRVEFYWVGASAGPLKRFLFERKFLTPDEARQLLYERHGLEAVRHLFAVASGVDSMVTGEAEILGQVKEAYRMAREVGELDRRLHIVFQEAFRAAGLVRSRTRIAEGRVSVSTVAVELAEQVFGTLTGRSVLIVGTGEMAEAALRALLAKGASTLYVVSRTRERAAAIAESYGGQPLVVNELPSVLSKADLVLVSTEAPHYVLGCDLMQNTLKERRNEPMLVIDISVPRAVDPAVGELDNVYLSNIDELQSVVQRNLAERQRELAACWQLIEEAALRCYRRLGSLEVGEVAADLRSSFDSIRREELQELFRRANGLSEEQRREVERMAERFQSRLLHGPLSALHEEAGRGAGRSIIQVIRRLFGLQ